jgi:glycosyltransferase involved in cell wall biosynthesis
MENYINPSVEKMAKEDNQLCLRKAIGRGHLNANRIEDALSVFTTILQDFPNDVETLLLLGDLYLASGDSNTAAELYCVAKRYDINNQEIEQRIQLAAVEQISSLSTIPEPQPTQPEAISRLLQRLTGRENPIPEIDINRAASLLDRIIHSSNPGDQVAENLDEIDDLLPALIELNIRQAISDGHTDLGEALRGLQTNVILQMRQNLDRNDPVDSHGNAQSDSGSPQNIKIELIVPDPNKLSMRMTLLCESLQSLGVEYKFTEAVSLATEEKPQIVIASNPHGSPAMMEKLAIFAAAQIPVIVDLDRDFEQMPIDHPDFPVYGLGTPSANRALTASMLLANRITVPCQSLATNLKAIGNKVQVVPDGWSSQSILWNKPSPKRNRINIGWFGTPGQIDDIVQIRRILIRVLREIPNTQLVISGDPSAYQLFENLSENRRIYLAPVPEEDFPYLLSQIDILVAPFRNIPYYRSQSERILMEAGVKRIPWIASPMPAFLDWGTGGLIASTMDEWHTYLRQLVLDDELRMTLGNTGRAHAEKRENTQLRQTWFNAILETMRCAARTKRG